MTKQETIQRIDEELIEMCNFFMDNDAQINEKGIEYTKMLANAKIALCTNYETKSKKR